MEAAWQSLQVQRRQVTAAEGQRRSRPCAAAEEIPRRYQSKRQWRARRLGVRLRANDGPDPLSLSEGQFAFREPAYKPCQAGDKSLKRPYPVDIPKDRRALQWVVAYPPFFKFASVRSHTWSDGRTIAWSIYQILGLPKGQTNDGRDRPRSADPVHPDRRGPS